jgi:hypothetical protein
MTQEIFLHRYTGVADPDPGSDAFLPSGSDPGNKISGSEMKTSWIRIRDKGSEGFVLCLTYRLLNYSSHLQQFKSH